MSEESKVDGPATVSLYLPNLIGGGAERMMVALAHGLVRRGIRVDVVLARAYGEFLDELPDEARLVDLKSPGVLASIPRLASYLRRTRPDAALATLPHASIALLWANSLSGTDTPVFVRVPTTPSAVEPGLLDVRRRLMPMLMRYFYPRAAGVVAVSKGVANDLHEFLGLGEKHVTTIYNPVVTPELFDRMRDPVDHPWFQEGDPPVILSVGRLGREKDFATLVRAVALVREERPVRLLILGEGSERQNLLRLIAELDLAGEVQMPGFVGNPFPYMAAASLYVLSSRREGLPGALIQAMACGCPVVSTDCPSGPAEVLDGGRFGDLVPVGDHQALAQAIVRTIDHPPDVDALRQRSLEFSERQSIDGYLQLMLGRAPRGEEVVTASDPARSLQPDRR